MRDVPRGLKHPMAHTYTSLYTHATFSTADRQPLITQEVRARLHAYIAGVSRALKALPLSVGGVSDHVHILVKTPPHLALSDFARVVKANSSKWMNETFTNRFAWQRGFGAFSVSKSNIATVAAYIREQEQHHRVHTFEEEFKALLDRNGVEYELNFLFK